MTTAPTSRFSTLLKHYRRAVGLTQEALAERAGLSARGIQDLERGVSRSPRQDTVDLLAAALGLSGEDHAELAAAARPPATPASPPAPLVAPVRAAAQPSGALLPLVGRGRELAALERFLAGGGEGEPSFPLASAEASAPVLLLAGEPGIGKTRLLQAAAQQASTGGWRVLAGGCHRRGGQESYAPLLDALARHLHALPPERLPAALEGCAWLARLLPELADALEPLPAAPLPPGQERRLMFAAVGRLLANVAGLAGTLLLLDDLQWAGPDALDLLAALVHSPSPAHRERGGVPLAGGVGEGREAPLRVVGAYRDTEVGPADPLGLLVADLAQAGLARQHALGPLAPEEAAVLLDDLLAGVAGGNRAVAARVLERAGGAPFFLVSYAQALRAGGTEAAPWDVAQGVRQRVAMLPEAGREVLGAAVVGRRVPRALLTAAVGQPEGAVLAGLEAACRARLLVEEGEDGYAFAHDVVREVVEADLSAARRALHGRVAAALEDAPAVVSPETLAYHYARGGDGAKAASSLERARGPRARQRRTTTVRRCGGWMCWVGRRMPPARAASWARSCTT